MQPRQIRVFDGLRITTEHLDHLQDSFQSALQDIRGILGLGRVHHGFEVTAEDERHVAVQPGLAFDLQKNRIVASEPKILEVELKPGDVTYVCLKYEQVEDYPVEGHCTRLWDSCSVVTCAEAPKPGEDMVPIARVTGGSGGLEVSDLAPRQIEGFAVAGNEDTKPEGLEPEGPAEPPGRPGESASAPVMGTLRVRQGVVRMAAEPDQQECFTTLMAEALKQRRGRAGSLNDEELLFTLAETDVALDFPVSSLTCQTIISGAASIAETAGVAEAATSEAGTEAAMPPEDGGTPAETREDAWRYRATAHGEAAFSDGGVVQSGLSGIHVSPHPKSNGVSWSASELTERAVAHLPFRTASSDGQGEADADDITVVLDCLQLLVTVRPLGDRGFRIVCGLSWKGTVDGQMNTRIQAVQPRLRWETVVAWKALGQS